MTNMTSRAPFILKALRSARIKGRTIAELMTKFDWETENDRASVSSVVSRLVNEGTIKEIGKQPRGRNGCSATVYAIN